jgi:hypothetical protein
VQRPVIELGFPGTAIILKPRLRLKHWLGLLLLAASCRPAASGLVIPGGGPCYIPPDGPGGRDTVSIAFSERENDAGRQFRRFTGETLIRVDCEDRIHPGLARRWTRDASGTVWSFELETSISAQSLVEQWDLGRNGGIWAWVRILEVRAAGPDRVEVRLDTIFAQIPTTFAIPGLSVSPSAPTDSGPVGRITIHPWAVDQRDLIDPAGRAEGGMDLVITRDPVVVEYARIKPDFSVIALPWDRAYLAVIPVVGPDLESAGAGFRESLARDVVRARSRAAQGPFWWEGAPCRGTMPIQPMGRQPQVVYLQGDQTAREVAERLVATQRTRLRATGLALDAFTASLAGGEAAMYVLSLPRTFPGNCSTIPAWPSASSLTPLIDVGAHALVRSGVPALTIEGDGTIRFDHLLPIISSLGPGR